MHVALPIVIVLCIFEGVFSFSTASTRKCGVSGLVVGSKHYQQHASTLSSSQCIKMALALPVPLPPTVAFPSPVSLSSFPGMIRKVTSKAAPLVVLGGLLVAVQKKALGLSKDMEGKIYIL